METTRSWGCPTCPPAGLPAWEEYPERWEDQKHRTSNSGLEYSCVVDYTGLKWIFLFRSSQGSGYRLSRVDPGVPLKPKTLFFGSFPLTSAFMGLHKKGLQQPGLWTCRALEGRITSSCNLIASPGNLVDGVKSSTFIDPGLTYPEHPSASVRGLMVPEPCDL